MKRRNNPPRGRQTPPRSGGRSHVLATASRFAPVFSHSPDGVWWRGFVPCLLAAFVLRVGVGLAGDWMVRPDEIYKHLEPAHQLVFGYGQTVWEFSLGTVTWLLPALPALPMFLCTLLGLEHPDFYIPAVKIWNALLSLSIPAGMYLFGRRVMSEYAARLALLFGCFWHEFVIMSSHTFAEQYAAVMFFAALALLSPAASLARLSAAGCLLGLTMALRFHYLPLVGIVGLAMLAAYPPARWSAIFIGGTAMLVLWGAAEYMTWGRWWSSVRLYLDLFLVHNFYDFLFHEAQHPYYKHLSFMAGSSYGLYALAVAALFRWRRHWLLISMSVGVLLLHMWAANKEYTNVFVLLPLLWMLIASATGDFFRSRIRVGAMVATGMVAALASVASVAAGVPNPEKSYNAYTPFLMPHREGLFHSEEPLIISRDIARIPADEVSAVMWLPIPHYHDGGYYHTHHRVPMLFPSRNPDHGTLYRNRPTNTLASHVIAGKDEALPGFSLKRTYGRFAMFVNDTPEAVQVPDNFATDFGSGFDRLVLKMATDMKVDFLAPPRTFLFPDRAGKNR